MFLDKDLIGQQQDVELFNNIGCLDNLEGRLLDKWIVILKWYFQAIPRPFGCRRNVLLPVVANALGTLLENLARIILVDEELNPA